MTDHVPTTDCSHERCPLTPPCSAAQPCGLRLVGYRLREDASQLIGLLELVLESLDGEEQRQGVRDALRAAERLHLHHRDLLALAQLGVPCIDVAPPERIHLGELVARCTKQAFARAMPEGQPAVVVASSGGPAEVVAPVPVLQRAIALLLADVVACTPGRVVHLAVERRESGTGPTCAIVVKGTGLDAPALAIVHPERGREGQAPCGPAPTSMGVFISRVLIGLIGGALSFETTPLEGTTVRVEFPAAPAA